MLTRKIPLVLSLIFLLTACEQETILTLDEISEKERPDYAVEEDGIMHFSSFEDLDNYLSDIEDQLATNEEDQSNARVIPNINLPEGFLPLAYSYDPSSGKNARTAHEEEGYSAELEQVINENLIPNEALHYVLDRERRVKISGQFYQVTEAGAFMYHPLYVAEFEELYENFLTEYLNYTEQIDSVTYRYGNILLKDDYGFVARQDLTEEKVIDFITGSYETFDEVGADSAPANARSLNIDYTGTYGLRTVGTNLFNTIGILNVRTAMFGSDYRVAVSLDEVDFLGYLGYTNFKVKFQHKKRVRPCIKIFGRRICKTVLAYWVKRTASRMAVGIDSLKTQTTYSSGIIPPQIRGRDIISKSVGNAAGALFYQGIVQSDIVKDWTIGVRSFGTRFTLAGIPVPIGQSAWKFLTSGFENEISRRTNASIRRVIGGSDTPAMMVSDFDRKQYHFFNGLTTYYNRKEKKVKFLELTVGASVSIRFGTNVTAHPSSFTDASKVKLVSGSIFGAAYHNGRWRGVRVVK